MADFITQVNVLIIPNANYRKRMWCKFELFMARFCRHVLVLCDDRHYLEFFDTTVEDADDFFHGCSVTNGKDREPIFQQFNGWLSSLNDKKGHVSQWYFKNARVVVSVDDSMLLVLNEDEDFEEAVSDLKYFAAHNHFTFYTFHRSNNFEILDGVTSAFGSWINIASGLDIQGDDDEPKDYILGVD